MKDKLWPRLLPLTGFLVTVVTTYAIYPERIRSDYSVLTAAFLLGLSIANAIYSIFRITNKTTNASIIGTIGIEGFFVFLCVVAASAAVLFSIQGATRLSYVADILCVGSYVFSIGVVKLSSNILDDVFEKNEFTSPHVQWSQSLKQLSLESGTPKVQLRMLQLSENAQYLSRSVSADLADVNAEIDSAISAMANCIRNEQHPETAKLADSIELLFANRESKLLRSRSKV